MSDIFGQQPDLVGEIQAEKAYGPIYSAQYRDAMKSARANELARRLGIAPDIVEADIPNMMARDRLDRAVAESRRNSAYAKMMANPRLAAAGIDDPHLPAVAKAVDQHGQTVNLADINRQSGGGVWGELGELGAATGVLATRVGTGIADLLSSVSGLAHVATDLGDANGLPLPMFGPGSELRLLGMAHQGIRNTADKSRVSTENRNFNDVASGVEGVPTALASLVATAYGGPVAGAAVFGGQGLSDAYDEGRDAGLSVDRAALYGVGDAAINAGTMFLPEKYLGGVMAGKGGIGKTLGSAVGLTEVQTAMQGLNHWYFIDKPRGVTFDQFVASLPDQMRSTFVSTLTMMGLTVGAGHVASKMAGHATDTRAAESLDSVMEAAAKSSTRTSNPSDFESALNQLVGDTDASDIYVPADKVLELFQPQEGKPQRDLRSDPFWGQYAPQIEEAGTLGGDVVVPLSSAATHLAGSPDWAAIRDHVRTRPGGASRAELSAGQSPEELESLASDIAEKLDRAVPQLKAQALTKEFAANLGYKGEQADAVSGLLAAGLARAHALEVARSEASGRPAPSLEGFAKAWLPQAEKTTQAAFDAARKGNAGVTSEAAQEFGDTQRRGNISIARDDQGLMTNSVIRAFEHADFSTAIHETGHFFLEDLKRRALGEGATDQEKADWQAAKDWMGHGDDAIPEASHEQFARGFERYIYEGKAPSAGLKALFAKMRDFMVSLYRSVRSFNSPISPEIRSVMDRLLASDDEINARREELRLGDQALSDLMSGEEQARYAQLGEEARSEARDRLYDRVLSTLRAERTREVARRKNEIRQDVGDQVDAEPAFRALKTLRSGRQDEDGNTTRVTLPRQWLVDNYGEDVLGKLPKGVPPIVDDAHAVDPESLAQEAGFESADQMVRSLIDHEDGRQKLKANGDNRSPRRATVETETESRLRSELGDPFANLEEEADAALANDRQADRLSLELRALSRKTGKAPVPWKQAQAWARAHVRSSTVRDTAKSVQLYSRNAAKASQNVEEALAGGDHEAAFRAKQQQVLNLALMSEAKAAKDETILAAKRLRKIGRAKTISSVDQDYLDQAHRLLENVDMKARTNKAVDKRLAFEAWHARQVEQEIDPIVPPEYQSILGQTHWTRLSVNDLLDLDKAVKQIVKLGRLKQELKDGKKTRDFNEAKLEMMDSGGQVPPRKVRGGTTDPSRSLPGRIFSSLRSADAFNLKIERLLTWLDNYDPNGSWTRMVYRPFADAQGLSSDMMREYTKGFNDIVKSLPKETARSWLRKVDTPELIIRNKNHVSNGQAWRGTKDQIVIMALNWGNLGNRQRLLDGFGWDEKSVASVFDRTLTKNDWDFVQKTWDSLEPLGQKMMELEADVNGVAPEKVEAAGFNTPHGEMRGGYFPIVYDPSQSSHAQQLSEDKAAPSGGWWSVTSRASASKERVNQVKGRPLLLSMDVLTRHVGEVIHDVSHRKALNQAKKILGDPDLAGIINARFGPEYTKAALAWVEGIAKPNTAYSRASPFELKVARYLNRAVTAVGLGFRLTVLPIQLAGIPFSAKDLKTPALAESLKIVTAHPIKAYNEMLEHSAEMRARTHAIDATIMDMVSEQGNGKLRTIGLHGWDKYAYQGIAYMDVISRTTVWTAGWNKALKEGMSDEEAVYYADRAVRQSHGIGFQKDRAALQRAHPIVRALYPFFSYQNALWNEFRDLIHRGNVASDVGDWAEIARRSWWIAVIPPLIHAAIHGAWPKSKDGGPLTAQDLTLWLLNQMTLGAVHSLPALGNIADAVEGGYGYKALNWEELGSDIHKGLGGIKKAATGEDELHGSAIKSAMTALGILTAKPLGQIGATSGGLYDYAKGDVHPHNVGDWEKLITTGKIPDQPVQ